MALQRTIPSTTGTRSVSRSIGALGVDLRSDLKQVLEDFASIYPSRPPEVAETEAAIQIEVRRSGLSRMGRRLYRVYADGEEIGGQRLAHGVFPLVEWGINLRVMATRSEYLQLHAASLAYRGNGFIFAGDSGCGKSTLSAILLARGWRYLCDEFALLDRNTLCLHPFPKALCVKEGAFPVIRRLGLPFARRRDYIKEFKGRVGYISPLDVGPDTVAEATPARRVVFPRYVQGSQPRLQPIPPAHAVLDLFRCCFNRNACADAALPALTKLVNDAPCFQLDVGEPEETGRLLESLVSEPAVGEVTAAPVRRSNPSDAHLHRDRVGGLRSRREILRLGAKLAYVAPVVVTLSANEALAAASDPSGICSTAKHTGQLCETDTDCCTRQCAIGICK